MSETISLEGLDKAEVLAALYNASKPLGMGFMHYDSSQMTKEEAQECIEKFGPYFDYLKGRVMKIDLSSDDLQVGLYDRDNGQGAAKRVVDLLRETGEVFPEESELRSLEGTRREAIKLKEIGNEPSELNQEGNMFVAKLGLHLDDNAQKKIDDIIDDK